MLGLRFSIHDVFLASITLCYTYILIQTQANAQKECVKDSVTAYTDFL